MIDKKEKSAVLIVEDDIVTRKTFSHLLKGSELHFCDSAKEMMEKLKIIENLSLILMDIGLKGEKNGLELTKELKNDPKYKQIPIIVITSYVNRFQKSDSEDAGADGYITKPIKRKELIGVIEQFLNISL